MYTRDLVWADRNYVYGMPIGIDRYGLSKEHIRVDHGFWTRHLDEISLRYVRDIVITKSLTQRLFGCGTIILKTDDRSRPVIVLKDVRNPDDIAELIHEHAEVVHAVRRSRIREYCMRNPFHVAELLRNKPELMKDEDVRPFIHYCWPYIKK